MKKILITGKNSYIGVNFIKHLSLYSGLYETLELDLKELNWINYDFSPFDVVYHVAGIAHSDNDKISREKALLYTNINTELTIKCASKAKASGVKQFIFMSSSIVYGNSSKIGKSKIIDFGSKANPVNAYGQSKLEAENALRELEDNNFKVCIIRSPMVYGKDSKGNFPLLEKYAKYLPIFPYIKNERSVIYIKNLVEFVRLIIDNDECGTFFPQNKEYINTSMLVKQIGIIQGKKIKLLKGFAWVLKFVSLFTPKIDKAFGSLTYTKQVSKYKDNYVLYSLKESLVDMYK